MLVLGRRLRGDRRCFRVCAAVDRWTRAGSGDAGASSRRRAWSARRCCRRRSRSVRCQSCVATGLTRSRRPRDRRSRDGGACARCGVTARGRARVRRMARAAAAVALACDARLSAPRPRTSERADPRRDRRCRFARRLHLAGHRHRTPRREARRPAPVRWPRLDPGAPWAAIDVLPDGRLLLASRDERPLGPLRAVPLPTP